MIPRVYFIGTAGSGKTTLVKAFHDWLENQNFDSIIVNLDPGAEVLPYSPDIDIRENISLESVMEQYALGPNGAQVLAADLIVQEIERIKETIDSYDSDYVLIDAPGQLELFAFRESSRRIIADLGSESSAIVYLLDSALMENAYSYISAQFLALSVLTRFYIPFLPAISKTDLITPDQKNMIASWNTNREELVSSLRQTPAKLDVQFSENLIQSIDSIDILGKPIFCSSESSEGMEDIYSFLQNLFYGSDDLEKR
jgi:GTPase SAR1 family protein